MQAPRIQDACIKYKEILTFVEGEEKEQKHRHDVSFSLNSLQFWYNGRVILHFYDEWGEW